MHGAGRDELLRPYNLLHPSFLLRRSDLLISLRPFIFKLRRTGRGGTGILIEECFALLDLGAGHFRRGAQELQDLGDGQRYNVCARIEFRWTKGTFDGRREN